MINVLKSHNDHNHAQEVLFYRYMLVNVSATGLWKQPGYVAPMLKIAEICVGLHSSKPKDQHHTAAFE